MGREWCAAHIQNVSQEELESAWIEIIAMVSDHKIAPIDKQYYPQTNFSDHANYNLLSFLSPKEDGWITIMAFNPRLLFHLFEKFSYTGILATAVDEFKIARDDFWEFIVFNQGVIDCWLISNPKYRFMDWCDTLEEIVHPYLTRNFNISLNKNQSEIRNIYRENPQYFQKPNKLVNEMLGFKLDQIIADLLPMPPFSMFESIQNNCAIPYFGIDYHIYDIATYLDTTRGLNTSGIDDLYYLQTIETDRTKRPISWEKQVEKLSPQLFEIDENSNFHEIFMDNIEKFVFY